MEHNKLKRIITLPIALILFTVLIPFLILFITYGLITGTSGWLLTNTYRRFTGKTPKLYCRSKECLQWSPSDAKYIAAHFINYLTSVSMEISAKDTKVKDFNIDWITTCKELADEVLAVIEKKETSPEEIYALCTRIRVETRGIKGINELEELHDWLLERADNMK